MTGLTPEQTGDLIHAGSITVLLVVSAAVVWLHKHRYTLRGIVRRALKYL